MQWTLGMQQRHRMALALAFILVLLLVKQWIDRRHLVELGESFASVYHDRLLVENYIYQLSEHLFQKKMMLDACEQQGWAGARAAIETHNHKIAALLADYDKTVFTAAEETYYRDLKLRLSEMSSLEQQLMAEGAQGVRGSHKQLALETAYYQASGDLHQLSTIQVVEGKQLTENSVRIVAGSSLLSQLELAMLVLIGIVIQLLLFNPGKVKPKFTQRAELN